MATDGAIADGDGRFDLRGTSAAETIRLVAGLLTAVAGGNDAATTATATTATTMAATRFHARTAPAIDVHGYLARILKYAPCGAECFLAVLVYFERMAACPPGSLLLPSGCSGSPDGSSSSAVANDPPRQPIVISSFNVHRLLIAGCMVAVKFLSDVFYTNSHMAKVGGLHVRELNRLEIEFLIYNDFNINVKIEELQLCGDRLIAFDRERQRVAAAVALAQERELLAASAAAALTSSSDDHTQQDHDDQQQKPVQDGIQTSETPTDGPASAGEAATGTTPAPDDGTHQHHQQDEIHDKQVTMSHEHALHSASLPMHHQYHQSQSFHASTWSTHTLSSKTRHRICGPGRLRTTAASLALTSAGSGDVTAHVIRLFDTVADPDIEAEFDDSDVPHVHHSRSRNYIHHHHQHHSPPTYMESIHSLPRSRRRAYSATNATAVAKSKSKCLWTALLSRAPASTLNPRCTKSQSKRRRFVLARQHVIEQPMQQTESQQQRIVFLHHRNMRWWPHDELLTRPYNLETSNYGLNTAIDIQSHIQHQQQHQIYRHVYPHHQSMHRIGHTNVSVSAIPADIASSSSMTVSGFSYGDSIDDHDVANDL